MLARIVRMLLGLTRLEGAFRHAESRRSAGSIFAHLVDELDLRLAVAEHDVRRIPANGPLVVVANHPTGAMEGIALTARIETVRRDVKVLGHSWFASHPSLAERMFIVEPAADEQGRARNAVSMRAAARWVARGGALVVFPAGCVARFQWSMMRITDPPWRSGLVRLLEQSPALVLPVHVGGCNGPLFQLLSSLHPGLGTLLLARELLSKRGRRLEARIGNPLPSTALPRGEGRRAALENLRRIVFSLDSSRELEGVTSCYGR